MFRPTDDPFGELPQGGMRSLGRHRQQGGEEDHDPVTDAGAVCVLMPDAVLAHSSTP